MPSRGLAEAVAHQHHSITVTHQDGGVGQLGQLAHLQRQGRPARSML